MKSETEDVTPSRRPEQKFKTCRRYDVPGDAHSLTFTCFHRRDFLSTDRSCQWLVEAIVKTRASLEFDLWAYVFMPDHCHILLLPRREVYSISRMIEAIKLPVTRKASAYLRRHAPQSLAIMRDEQPNGSVAYRFWQRGGGYDRNMMEPQAIHAEIDYIHANPVRRGLVAKAEEWRWSSAAWYVGRRDVPLVPDAGSIPPVVQS
jgi:putative transposase